MVFHVFCGSKIRGTSSSSFFSFFSPSSLFYERNVLVCYEGIVKCKNIIWITFSRKYHKICRHFCCTCRYRFEYSRVTGTGTVVLMVERLSLQSWGSEAYVDLNPLQFTILFLHVLSGLSHTIEVLHPYQNSQGIQRELDFYKVQYERTKTSI